MTEVSLADAALAADVREQVAIVADHVVVAYGGVRAVDGVSLRAEPGVVTGLIGPNGAGKSSLVSVIAGAQRLTEGRVLLGDRDITQLRPHQRSNLGLMRSFQTARVFPRLSVIENVIAGAKPSGVDGVGSSMFARSSWRRREDEVEERAFRLLTEFGIDAKADERCGDLSGGQRRIVEYLRLLMGNPRAILLDEPTVGMAPWLVTRLGDDLDALRTRGVSTLLIGHEMSFIRQICDVVVVMANGKVIATGSFDEIADNDVVREAYLGRRAVEA